MMEGWKPLKSFSEKERQALRWILRYARTNGVIEAGVALKFGREWLINVDNLPAYLHEQTMLRFRQGKR